GPRRHVELEARRPRRADRGSRCRADRAGARARAPSRQPGPRSDAHLPQPARRLRDRRPDQRAPARTERRRVRAAADDATGGRRGDHRRQAHEGLGDPGHRWRGSRPVTSADVVGPDRAPPLEEEQLPGGVRGAWERTKLNVRTGNLGAVPLIVGEIAVVIVFGFTATNFFTSTNFVNLIDRKSTRLNSSHDQISYAVF